MTSRQQQIAIFQCGDLYEYQDTALSNLLFDFIAPGKTELRQ
jgi:hypothetical protein